MPTTSDDRRTRDVWDWQMFRVGLTWKGRAAALWNVVRPFKATPHERCAMGYPVPMAQCPRRAMADDRMWCRRHDLTQATKETT